MTGVNKSAHDGREKLRVEKPMTTTRAALDFQQYRRTAIAEMRPWQQGDDMTGVSVSAEDAKAGSPKAGDMIARNPKNHADQWLVAKQYAADNFATLSSALSAPGEAVALSRSTLDQLNAVAPAVENLSRHQEQCDMDGCMVKVSRQALDQVLNAINEVAILCAQQRLTESSHTPAPSEIVHVEPRALQVGDRETLALGVVCVLLVSFFAVWGVVLCS